MNLISRVMAVVMMVFSGYGTAFANGQVCDRKQCFEVEIAVTPDELSHGLMERSSLAAAKGMLFVFDAPAKQAFWMKNTWIPLDMIWIAADGTIVDMAVDVPPCPSQGECPAINPSQEASYVLEINAGVAKRDGLAIGEKLIIK